MGEEKRKGPMNNSGQKAVAVLTLFLFLAAMIPPAFGQSIQSEEKALKLLAEGESLFKSFEYEGALEKYREAFPGLSSKNSLVRFYLDISLAYYALGDEPNAKAMLGKMFELDDRKEIEKENYPKGFFKIYMDVRIENSSQGTFPKAMGQEGKVEKKKTPWVLIIGGAVVVGAVLIYFLLPKKSATPATAEKFTLTVTKGTGVLGSPNSGTYTYERGAIASYTYSLEIDYLFYDLIVKLDGVEIPISGNITMDRNHTLNASAVGFWKR